MKVCIVDKDMCIDLAKLITILDGEHASHTTEKIRSCIGGLVDIFVDDYSECTRRSMDLAAEWVAAKQDDIAIPQSRRIDVLENQAAILLAQRRETADKLALAKMHFEANFGRKLEGGVWTDMA